MNIEIANRLFELRKKSNLSQEELAEKIGVSRQAVSKWERAEASPDTDNLVLLAKLYGVSLDEILKTDEPVSPPEEEYIPEQFKQWRDADHEARRDAHEERTFAQKFPYPIVVTFIFLLLGFFCGLWHPGWLVFLTIPVYYAIADACAKHKRKE